MATKTRNPYLDFDFSKFADFGKLSESFKVPGVDAGVMIETQRKNLETITVASQIAYEGVQAIAQRQAEIVRQAMSEAVKATQELSAVGTPQDRLAKQTDLAKQSYETTVANFRELAEINAKSGAEVIELYNKRITEGLDEVKQALQGAAK